MKKKEKKTGKRKEKKNDKDALPLKVIMKNNIWALSILHQAAPGYVFVRLSMNILYTVVNFIVGSWLLRYILNSYSEGQSQLLFVLIAIVLAYSSSFFLQVLDSYLGGFVLVKKPR